MTKYRVTWHSFRTGRDYAAKTPYATREQAQANADFNNERYSGLGLVYDVQPVDDPAADPGATETVKAKVGLSTGSAGSVRKPSASCP